MAALRPTGGSEATRGNLTVSAMSDWTAADLPSFSGRTVIVTGANSGLGLVHARAGPRRRQGDLRRAQYSTGATARPRPAMTGDVEVRKLDLQDLASVREFADGVAGRRCAGQQRRDHGGALRADRRRIRKPDRHQPPRPLRADQPAAAEDHRPRGDGVVDDASDGLHQPQGPELEVAAVPGLAGVRAVEAREPAVHQRAAAPPRRRGVTSRRTPRIPATRRPICSRHCGPFGEVFEAGNAFATDADFGARQTLYAVSQTCPATVSSARGSSGRPTRCGRPLARDAKNRRPVGAIRAAHGHQIFALRPLMR